MIIQAQTRAPSLGGWVMHQTPSSKTQRRALEPHIATSELRWYARGVNVARYRKYIIALLRFRELAARGTVKQVHHCQSMQYYAAILKEKTSGEVLVELEDDDNLIELEDDAGSITGFSNSGTWVGWRPAGVFEYMFVYIYLYIYT